MSDILNNPEELVKLFPVKMHYLYFNFAADGPLPVPAKNAVCQALDVLSLEGMMAVDKQIAIYENIRQELAILFQSKPDHFAFIKNTSEGVLLALLALDIREDENYIVAEDAFPTTIRMMESNCRGEMRKIKINSPLTVQDQLMEVIDKKTRAIVLDWAHFFTGKIIDLEAITQLAHNKNIFTIIDGIQGAGAVSIELDSSGIDFFMSGGHKWLLSPQGSGFIYVSPRVWEKIPRKSFGWLGYNWRDFSDFDIEPELREGAAVMEYGTRSYTAAVGFYEGLKLFNHLGIKNIEKNNQDLKEFFLENLLKKGYETISPGKSAPIVSFKLPGTGNTGKDSRVLLAELSGRKVRASLRNGYIRVGFHLVNDRGEVRTLLDYL